MLNALIKLEIEENSLDYWRRCIQKTMRDEVRNENLKREMGVQERITGKSDEEKA